MSPRSVLRCRWLYADYRLRHRQPSRPPRVSTTASMIGSSLFGAASRQRYCDREGVGAREEPATQTKAWPHHRATLRPPRKASGRATDRRRVLIDNAALAPVATADLILANRDRARL